MPTKGLVFSISRFVVDDGPGLRTTVFLKGCPLKCIWCHSPESQSGKPQLAFYNSRCISCGICARACPQGAHIVSATERYVLWERCDNCGKCAESCPSKALEMVGEWLTVEQVMDVVERDLVYYRNSGGGVTFSGGEPTMQPEFLASCLKRCKDIGIHTALDTCGFARWSVFEEILPYLDLLLYDIKHMDTAKHGRFTGVPNHRILDNLKRIGQHGKSIWVRIPLIPGYNDSEGNLDQIAEFVKTLRGVEQVWLMPCNPATGAKYKFIGRDYELEQVIPHAEEKAMVFVQIFSRLGIKAEFGKG